jgi:hypothetical protein
LGGHTVSKRASTEAAFAAIAVLAIWALVGAGVARADHQVTDLVSTGPAGGNADIDVGDLWISPDGSRSFFKTTERLVPADADDQLDVYRRADGSTTLVSTGPTGGNGPFPVSAVFSRGISRDGTRVAFATRERLSADDTDDHVDLYERADGVTALVSFGPAGGNGAFDVDSVPWMSSNGEAIVFITAERLTTDDTNSIQDVYLRAGAQTTLISVGPDAPGTQLWLVGISSDGQRVFFGTSRRLWSNDTDFLTDIYKWEDGLVTMETVGPNGENGDGNSFSEYIDQSGTRLFFATPARLVPGALVNSAYERVGGTTRLVTVGSAGQPAGGFVTGVSADGSHAFFLTSQQLVPEDTDTVEDLYVRANGTTALVSAGPLAGGEASWPPSFRASSTDGTRAFFITFERLTPEDTDGGYSAYEYSGGESARWLSPAVGIAGLSRDGARVFVVTNLPLLPSDTDPCTTEAFGGLCADVYEIHAGRLTLVSTGPADSGQGSVCRTFIDFRISFSCPLSTSDDGRRVLFWHDAPLLAGDTDSSFDVYLASAGPVRSDYRNAQQFCRAERSFLGAEAFRERYGSAPKHRNAFRNCVRANRR